MKAVAIAVVALIAAIGCGGGEDSWCPGTVCNNCATDPACSVTCPQGKTSVCVGGAFFDADPALRCGYCQ